jgi:hypothetical protein
MFARLVGAGCAVSLLMLAVPAFASNRLVYSTHWGGAGVAAGRHTEDLCVMEGISGGGSRAVTVELTGGHVGHGPATTEGELFCARGESVWKGPTPGPEHGFSIRCPHEERPIDGGAGYKAVGIDDGGHLYQAHVTQSSGGFGHNRDGYWHYKFHNWGTDHAHMRFWAVCVPR